MSDKWRHPLTIFILGAVSALIVHSVLFPSFDQSDGMQVVFHNGSDQLIQSIRLDFGHSNGQSSIQTFRIAGGDDRALLLNHEPGMGFNVVVTWVDGISQEFCALKGDESSSAIIPLTR